MIGRNPQGKSPQIHASAFVHSTAVVIGDVKIGKNVFIGPGAVIRADEPASSIFIADNCNIQDSVIVHALQNSAVHVDCATSLSHGCIVHGPCKIGKNCFIGFGAVVFNAEVGHNVIVKHLAVVEKVFLPAGKLVEPLQAVNTGKKARKLKNADKTAADFAANIIKINKNLARNYQNRPPAD